MIRKVISLLVLVLYVHGLSGYTMSFHTCMETGFQSVYTTFGQEDPCGEEKEDCTDQFPHFEEADCCDLDQTVINIDGETNLDVKKLDVSPLVLFNFSRSPLAPVCGYNTTIYAPNYAIVTPPDLCRICVFRI